MKQFDAAYPRASGAIDGRQVGMRVPNTDSISASLLEYYVLPGIREVSMSHFGGPRTVFYAADDFKRSESLAKQIASSSRVDPLIIVVDDKGPYILEGAHRYVALYQLKAKSFPALVVIDTESLGLDESVASWIGRNCKFACGLVLSEATE
jgi:hypothetical protein